MATMTKITSKRQITIPVELFRQLGLNEGDSIAVDVEDDHLILTPAQMLVREVGGMLRDKVAPDKAGKPWKNVRNEGRGAYFKNRAQRGT